MKTEEQVITKFKKKAQEVLKSDCLNKISYIIKPKNFIFTLLILTFLPGLISCGGEQRPASLVSATPPEKTSTGVVSPTKGADGRTTPSGGVTPPVFLLALLMELHNQDQKIKPNTQEILRLFFIKGVGHVMVPEIRSK